VVDLERLVPFLVPSLSAQGWPRNGSTLWLAAAPRETCACPVLLNHLPSGACSNVGEWCICEHWQLHYQAKSQHTMMHLTNLQQWCCCLELQAGAAMLIALLVLLVLNAYALIHQQLQQTTVEYSTLNFTPTHATPHAHSLPVWASWLGGPVSMIAKPSSSATFTCPGRAMAHATPLVHSDTRTPTVN
jgi:hypothetical protein